MLSLHSSLQSPERQICLKTAKQTGKQVNKQVNNQTWSEVGLAVETHGALFLSRHQHLIPHIHLQLWVHTGH